MNNGVRFTPRKPNSGQKSTIWRIRFASSGNKSEHGAGKVLTDAQRARLRELVSEKGPAATPPPK